MTDARTHPANRNLAERVAALRKQRKMTLEQLAVASGVSRSMLSQIERGSANPTLAVSFKIAEGFGTSIGELLGSSWNAASVDVVRANDPKTLFPAQQGCRIRTLSPLRMEKDIEFYELILEPGARLDSEAHHRGTRELLTVASGSVTVQSDSQLAELSEGDSAHYQADCTHSIINGADVAASCYLVVTYSG
ncbi:XRE family transcriptional regulator [Pontixanthobacter sp. CEM42]|uniref:helix-turn-helix domain-containing protein n=1 Tax=Pontixanthobacter sp. CEM42 TaxID=2792077 RepID=UPI001ADFD5CC|nr:XRE family transcriptional regulator [Pontixanthobacter sp. CEM42]